MDQAHVLIVGGGGTGVALAHDLALREIKVTLVERGELTSGTTGRHHGLLHSGARYAVGDQESAVECITENRILRRIAPRSFEANGGLFAAVTDSDLDYQEKFVAGCQETGIPTQVLTADQAHELEPNLHPAVRSAVLVPDATMDAMRLVLRFAATALRNGATIRPFTEVTGLILGGGRVGGAAVREHLTGRERTITADLVVNAGGPWSGRIAAMAGVHVPVRPSPGVLLALAGRLCDRVINRLHPSGDGDIVLPQRQLTVVGTSSWVTSDPDNLTVPDDHVEAMVREGSRLVSAVAHAPHRAAWSAARPLVGQVGQGADASGGRALSRTFKCFDHAVTDGVEGLVTITGGKATTLRAMAEAAADLACAKVSIQAPCRTRDVELLPHTAYYVPETLSRR